MGLGFARASTSLDRLVCPDAVRPVGEAERWNLGTCRMRGLAGAHDGVVAFGLTDVRGWNPQPP